MSGACRATAGQAGCGVLVGQPLECQPVVVVADEPTDLVENEGLACAQTARDDRVILEATRSAVEAGEDLRDECRRRTLVGGRRTRG